MSDVSSAGELVMGEATLAERRLAALILAVSIFVPILAPLVGLALFRRQKFVTAHALQALYGLMLLKVLLFTAIVISVSFTIYSLWGHYQAGWVDFSIWPILIRMGVGWLLLMILAGINFVVSVRDALRAWQGRWPKHGRVVRALHRRFG